MLAAAGLATGLALATHHFIALTFLAPAGAVVFARRAARPGLRAAGITAGCGILGLAALLYLPVRAAAHPEVDWGAPDTAARFAWTVSARAFQKSAGATHVSSPAEDGAQIAAALADHATPLLAALALLGLYLAVRRGWGRLGLGLGAIAAVCAAARVLIGFDPETPDHHGYLIPAVIAVMLLGAGGLLAVADAIAEARGPRAPLLGWGAAGLLALAVPYQLAHVRPEASLVGAEASTALADWQLASLPPRSLLLVAYFQTSFRLWAVRTVDGARPDVAVLDRSFLTYPGGAEEARRRYPGLAPLIDAPLRAGAPTPLPLIAEIAAHRPVLFELHPNLDGPVLPHLLPEGPFARFTAAPPSAADRDAAERRDQAARAALAATATAAAGPAELSTLRDALLWHDATRLRFYCALQRQTAADAALSSARTLAPDDPTLGCD
jgi:hypothetical protein